MGLEKDFDSKVEYTPESNEVAKQRVLDPTNLEDS